MKITWDRLSTWYKLGLRNIITVVAYRALKRFGYYKFFFPVGGAVEGPFFSEEIAQKEPSTTLTYFSFHRKEVSSPPDWFVNPWNGVKCVNSCKHWSEIPDFIPDLGDIKTVWEASRFDWLPRMAWAYRGGEESALARLELWLRDWTARNPSNQGVNWKCGQEASLRCLNIIAAVLVISRDIDTPRASLLRILEIHIQRIIPTFRYAIAQNNNHGISEAAALFVVGCYLSLCGNEKMQKQGSKWVQLGANWLENRVQKLILPDGSFSQYSVTYHRLVLDILSFVELIRLRFEYPEFSNSYYSRAKMAVLWLSRITDEQTGDAPNLGANDGAYLFNLDELEYRDFRPSVQLAAAVFLKKAAWAEQVVHPLLGVFNLNLKRLQPIENPYLSLTVMEGYAHFRSSDFLALLRLPTFRFRPSHADGLHLDLRYKGVNWIRDAGTYSYNTDAESLRYFPGTKSHSTVCFDDRDQMPRLGRFLFGNWLKIDVIEWSEQDLFVKCGYVDSLGACHIREIRFFHNKLCIIDTIEGFKSEAVIYWHLSPADWKLENLILSCESMKLQVESNSRVKLSLMELPESRYYFEQHNVPVLAIKSQSQGVVTTTISFID